MPEPYIGEIKMFAGGFAPRGYALCDGQLLAVSQYDALFSLLGTIYGGDGRTTFGLPDLRGRVPIHAGSGPGLTPRQIGSKSGTENVTLTLNEIPSHTHQPKASDDTNVGTDPAGNVTGHPVANIYRSPPDNNLNMATQAVANAGNSQKHTNLMPFQCINFIIALTGIYPSRT
jgi:microcystin-dependent protein